MKTLIRKTWPKIRRVTIKGEGFYRVDARRTGTNGKQETFKNLKDAEKRAGEIEKHFSTNGVEGLSFPVEIRGMAITATNLLQPYGKTIIQAAEFYKSHLDEIKKREDSALVSMLAKAWHDEKKSGKHTKLRETTLKDIRQTSEILTEIFPGKKILEITTADIQRYLDAQDVGLQRKFNINSRFSQFFNWCIKRGDHTSNPAAKISIQVERKDVSVFTPAEVLKLLNLCATDHKDFVLYHAISLFAGLRPEECRALIWENIHLEEKTITVLGATSKVKETRNVHIEETLLAWLDQTPAQERKGFVTPQTNFTNYLLKIHIAAGYRGEGQNTEADPWPQDVMRHSYGSYWLAKYRNRAQLAEYMGNSLQIIKKHYKKVVSKTDCAEYWRIVPGYDGRGVASKMPGSEEMKAARGRRLAKIVAAEQ